MTESLDSPLTLERVGRGGRARPAAVVVALVVGLALVVWAPWGRPASSGLTAPSAASSAAASEPALTATVGQAGVAASPFPNGALVPAGPTALPWAERLDDEWTVVAFLAPRDGSAYPAGETVGAGGPLIVRQQQLSYAEAPLERPAVPDAACHAPGGFLHAAAALLPAGQVRFLGVTFPGMSIRATVGLTMLGTSAFPAVRVPIRSVPAFDGPLVPPDPVSADPASAGSASASQASRGATGDGAAIFARVPDSIWPGGTYRFEVYQSAWSGPRYLYACIAG